MHVLCSFFKDIYGLDLDPTIVNYLNVYSKLHQLAIFYKKIVINNSISNFWQCARALNAKTVEIEEVDENFVTFIVHDYVCPRATKPSKRIDKCISSYFPKCFYKNESVFDNRQELATLLLHLNLDETMKHAEPKMYYPLDSQKNEIIRRREVAKLGFDTRLPPNDKFFCSFTCF